MHDQFSASADGREIQYTSGDHSKLRNSINQAFLGINHDHWSGRHLTKKSSVSEIRTISKNISNWYDWSERDVLGSATRVVRFVCELERPSFFTSEYQV